MLSTAPGSAASAPRMQGDLPPSSSVTGVKFSAAALATSRPTTVEPVNQMVEGETSELRAHFLVSENGCYLVSGKERAEELGDELRRAGREFRGLQHHPIARGKRGDERHDRKLKRIVPRADDSDDADRLIENSRPSRLQLKAYRDAPWPHPVRQVPHRVADRAANNEHFGEQALVSRAAPEI